MNDAFPEKCIRGISHSTFIDPDGTVSSNAFFWEKNREFDSEIVWLSQSINWHDEEGVIEFTFNQRKSDGTFQFNYGIVILNRDNIEHLSVQPTIRGILTYERDRLDHNPYHGNLLLQRGVPVLTMKKLAASLATIVSQIITRSQT